MNNIGSTAELLEWILREWDCKTLTQAITLAETDYALSLKLREAGISVETSIAPTRQAVRVAFKQLSTEDQAAILHDFAIEHTYQCEVVRPEERWGYSDTSEPESWEGSCKSREEAIEEAHDMYGNDVDVWIAHGTIYDPTEASARKANLVVAGMADAAGWECGEAAENWPGVTAAQIAELQSLIDMWTRKYCQADFWQANLSPELIVATATEPRWWGVWCERNEVGFWREVDGEPLQTTRTEAVRSADALNNNTSIWALNDGWTYTAKPYTK